MPGRGKNRDASHVGESEAVARIDAIGNWHWRHVVAKAFHFQLVHLPHEPWADDFHRDGPIREWIPAQREVRSRERPVRKALAQYTERRGCGVVVEDDLAVIDERLATGAGEIERVEVVEALVPCGFERSPEPPAIEATIAVSITGKSPEGGQQLTVRSRWGQSCSFEEIDVVHQHLGIRLPRKSVDPAVGEAQRRQHGGTRTLGSELPSFGQGVPPLHTLCAAP